LRAGGGLKRPNQLNATAADTSRVQVPFAIYDRLSPTGDWNGKLLNPFRCFEKQNG